MAAAKNNGASGGKPRSASEMDLPPPAAMHEVSGASTDKWMLAPTNDTEFRALPLNQEPLDVIPECVRHHKFNRFADILPK
jgi:hypothetical protein